MNGELRALGLVHGLLLGLLLASPVVAPALLPHAVSALFLLGGFQLRLADRRWDLRGGPAAWISHIRMAPRRLIPWGAAAVAALVAGQPSRALTIAGAALLSELLVYPICAHLLGQLTRPLVALILALLIALAGAAASETMAYVIAFMTGIATCLFWMRGPDGDARALAIALGGAAAAAVAPLALPDSLPFALPTGLVSATLALAHLSVLRRRPLPWQPSDGAQPTVRRPLWLQPPRLS